jgi:hypothetical protein
MANTKWAFMLCVPATMFSQVASAGERVYYECVLQQVLTDGRDVRLLLGTEDGQVRQHGLTVADSASTVCRMKEHGLKIAGGRLSGPMQIQVGLATERIELDVALDKAPGAPAGGGTYSIAYGCPEASRKAEGNVAIEEPKGEASKRWVAWLQDALKPDTRLGLAFNVDRKAKTLTALPASASGYNRGQHPVDAARLAFDGTNLEGEVGITIVPDQWTPAHGQPIEGSIKLKASLDGNDRAGTYSAVFGIEKRRKGPVVVKPGTEAGMRGLLAPILSAQTPWRAYLVQGPNLQRTGEKLQWFAQGRGAAQYAPFDPANPGVAEGRFTSQPPADWAGAAFDDRSWARYDRDDLVDLLGGDYGSPTNARGSWATLLYLRTSFGVADPARAGDLQVAVTCLGGGVVYVNGEEIGRGFVPRGAIAPLTPAEDYPIAAYTMEDGTTPLPVPQLTTPPEAKWLARYQQRVRTFTVAVPRQVLVKGRNVLAIGLRRAPLAGPLQADRGWAHLGVQRVEVTSESGAGVIPYPEAAKGVHLWSAAAEEQITDALSPRSLVRRGFFQAILWARGLPIRGVQQGNPFDPVLPIRMTVPRNGVGSGQTVLSDPEGLRGVSATVGVLTGPGGATIPAQAVRVRYAAQHSGVHYCDALMSEAPNGARTIPVWLIVQAPKNQAPGWYAATLALQANGQAFAVPVQVLVSGAAVPDARDFTSTIGVMTSPDTIAMQYNVEPWSPKHLALLEKSLELMGQVGNDVIHVPVILGQVGGRGKTGYNFNLQPMIRWVKTEQGLKPDYSILEKYLDAYTKHCAPPQAISLYIWSMDSTKEFAGAYENFDPKVYLNKTQENAKFTPPRVIVWDPKTGATAEQAVPVIGDPGSEQFWKPLVDGVRALVLKRGWSERIVMLGLGGDQRPGRKTVDLFKQWVPYARWNFLCHFSGDPGPKDGKLIASGGGEIGLKEWMWLSFCFVQPAARLEERLANPNDFVELPTKRWQHQEYSPPFLFRTLPQQSGLMGRIGLDFWMAGQRDKPRATSFFSHTNALTVPGPHGAVPTIRFQMLREGVQDMEVRLGIIRAYMKLPEERRVRYRTLLDELGRRVAAGGAYMSQHELQFDWPLYVAGQQAAAAELAGVTTDAKWETPPR